MICLWPPAISMATLNNKKVPVGEGWRTHFTSPALKTALLSFAQGPRLIRRSFACEVVRSWHLEFRRPHLLLQLQRWALERHHWGTSMEENCGKLWGKWWKSPSFSWTNQQNPVGMGMDITNDKPGTQALRQVSQLQADAVIFGSRSDARTASILFMVSVQDIQIYSGYLSCFWLVSHSSAWSLCMSSLLGVVWTQFVSGEWPWHGIYVYIYICVCVCVLIMQLLSGIHPVMVHSLKHLPSGYLT